MLEYVKRKTCKKYIIVLCFLLLSMYSIHCSKDRESEEPSPEEKLKTYRNYVNERINYLKQNYKPEEYQNLRSYKLLILQEEFLRNKNNLLNEPYLIRADIGLSDYTYFEILNLFLDWLAEDFDPKGIHISLSANNGARDIKLPLLEREPWHEYAKNRYKNQIDKGAIIEVIIGDSYKLKTPSEKDLPFNLIVPANVISEEITISLYDENDNKTNSVKLLISKEAQDYILAKREEVNKMGKVKQTTKTVTQRVRIPTVKFSRRSPAKK